MKNFKVITYIILMIAFSFSFSSCEKHDDIHYHSDCDIISIMVRANSPEDGTTYDGVISENGTIIFPNFINYIFVIFHFPGHIPCVPVFTRIV